MRRRPDGPVLDERQVDLDYVELELGQEAQPGVAGADVVGRDAHPGRATRVHRTDQPVHVLDGLAFGEFEDDPLRVDPVAGQGLHEAVDAEFVGFEGARRDVEGQAAGEARRVANAEIVVVEAGEVELHRPARRFRGGEQLAGMNTPQQERGKGV